MKRLTGVGKIGNFKHDSFPEPKELFTGTIHRTTEEVVFYGKPDERTEISVHDFVFEWVRV